MVTKSAVIGIDLGSSESYVAFVGKGIVDLVQNEVSKRATSTLVAFDDRERMLGDAALAKIKTNAKNTCRNFKHLLGRKADAPDMEIEHFWSTSKLVDTDDGMAGYDVTYKGESRQFSAVQITAAFLTKLREITEKWCQAKVADIVIACPSSFSDVQRQALLDAAHIAGLSVLRVMNEHTATALAYGIYRSNDFDPENPMTVAFCSMGHTIFSVSIVQFVRGKLTVLAERSDKVGGRDMDLCLMREFAAQFQKKHGCDPLSTKKSMLKLEDAVLKTKKILSANSDANFVVECLMEDHDFASQICRDDFEKMCEPMMGKVQAVLEAAKQAAGIPNDKIDSVEIVGGASRVPWFKRLCQEAFEKETLSTTMNQDESVARGCALQAAILSPLYKVRDFKVEDGTPFAVNVGWMGSSADASATQEEDGDTHMAGGEGQYKTATVFPANSMSGLLKMLTFWRNDAFDLKAEFADETASLLLPGTSKELGTFRVELPKQPEPKKVKVKAKLTLHGTFAIEGAQMVEEEEYEETVKEKRELPPEPVETPAETSPKEENGDKKEPEGDAPMPDAAAAQEGEKKEGDNGQASPKEPEKKQEPRYEWVDVVKKKRRTKRTEINITTSGRPGLEQAALDKRKDEEFAVQAEMREIIETDEKRNDLEAYIFSVRDKITESGEWGEFIVPADREPFSSELMKAEDWLYDNPEATKVMFIDKLEELKQRGDLIQWRHKESTMRAEWITAVAGTIKNYKNVAENPGDKYGHIAAEKLAKIIAACNEMEQWLNDTKAKQESLPKYEKPVLICADMEKKNHELANMADQILREPKPAPPKEPKKEETTESPKAEKEAPSPGEEAAGEAGEGPAEGPQGMDVD